MAYSPWGRKESDTTEATYYSAAHIGNQCLRMNQEKRKDIKKIPNVSDIIQDPESSHAWCTQFRK